MCIQRLSVEKPHQLQSFQRVRALSATVAIQCFICTVMDSKVCYILDDAYGLMQLTALRRRNKDGSYLTYRAHRSLYMYNKYMGGVDLWDTSKTNIFDRFITHTYINPISIFSRTLTRQLYSSSCSLNGST